MKIAVIGGGSWGRAIVKILSDNPEGNQGVNWWVRKPETVDFIEEHHHNPSYLTDVVINPERVTVSNNLATTIHHSKIIILAIPSAFLKETLAPVFHTQFKEKMIFSAIKGIIPDDLLIVGDFLNQKYNIPFLDIGVITGPCHAEEVAMEKLSYLTIASKNTKGAAKLASLMSCHYIKT